MATKSTKNSKQKVDDFPATQATHLNGERSGKEIVVIFSSAFSAFQLPVLG
jgi:hypothetical protein